MTREEMKLIMHTINLAYTSNKFVVTQKSFDLWYAIIGNLDYRTTLSAVHKYIADNEYPPTIAGIKKRYDDIADAEKEVDKYVREKYDTMSGWFSGGDATDAFKAYNELIGMAKNRVKAADWISSIAWQRKDTCDYTEFMLGLLNEQRGRS